MRVVGVVDDEMTAFLRKLARDGYSQEFGARKLGRAIRRQILDPLATAAKILATCLGVTFLATVSL